MLIDGTGDSFRWFEARVRLALNSARRVDRPIEKIAVSQWLFDELKYRYNDSLQLVRWFGITVDLDPTLTGQQARLS